jgi:hypothetical protein
MPARYFTFAGDCPLFMGAVTDWSKHTACFYAKSGVLMSGLALTPGVKTPAFYSEDIDLSSRWFHQADDVVAVFRNGWMEYELQRMSPYLPAVRVEMSAFPLLPDDGFLVHYRIITEQRVVFCAGFGGLTGFLGRFEYAGASVRNFHASDCVGNTVSLGKNRAKVSGPLGDTMWVGTSFPVDVSIGDADSMASSQPSVFLGTMAKQSNLHSVKFSTPIAQGRTLEGFIVAVRGNDEAVLDRWLTCAEPVSELKQRIREKHAAVSVKTPDSMLNLTVPPTVLAIDASWHKHTFQHGAHGYHSPFLGWRGWYGPTVIGWHDRVQTAIRSHFADIVKTAHGEDRVWYDGNDRPDLDHEGTQYHHLENSTGFIPCILGRKDIYNMQEVAVDMVFHHLQWTGDMELARFIFDDLSGILDWEERILDPDNDGLYQNFLNTWISDGHHYNGGGCAQASAYNYLANLIMGRIAKAIGRDCDVFKRRAERIRTAVQDRLWLPEKGVVAEYVDTIGNKLVHPSPELSTIYLAIDCGLVDMFQAYRMLRFTETDLRNERTPHRNGRLVYSSNWLPKKYSTCGLFPAENIHLAIAYFRQGSREKGLEILEALVDSCFSGHNPGLICHVLTGLGSDDIGDLDFSDVTSMYLRLLAEGLFGIRFNLLDGYIEISPGFPSDWTHAHIALHGISIDYQRNGREESFTVNCDRPVRKSFKIPLRGTQVESVMLNGTPVDFRIEPAVNTCFLIVSTEAIGRIELRVAHGGDAPPVIIPATSLVFQDSEIIFDVSTGSIADHLDDADVLSDVLTFGSRVSAKVSGASGHHTIFLRIKAGDYDTWLAADFTIKRHNPVPSIAVSPDNMIGNFKALNISGLFNASTTDLHTRQYLNPRPKGYSIGVRVNGRYAWEWNHCGHNALVINDSQLRNSGAVFTSPSGIPFSTPAIGPNLACASMWDNFPTTLRIPIGCRGSELAVFFVGITNAMQCHVENVRFKLIYADGTEETLGLVHPVSFDDWLVPALQTANETVYFSDYNHGIVQRLRLEPEKELSEMTVEAIANEVIIGILGISIRQSKGN